MAVRRVADESGAGLGALVRERDVLDEQWSANSSEHGQALASLDRGRAVAGQQRLLQAARARIEARISEVDAVLRRDFPQYFALVRPEALDVAAAQALLAPDEAVLMVVPTEFGTHVMAVTREGLRWERSNTTREQVDLAVATLLRDIRAAMAGTDYSYDRQTAHMLYSAIVAPVAPVLAGKRHVFVVTAGSLTSLPLGVLVTQAPQGRNDDPAALRATRWFAEAHALVQIPSIQSLQLLRRATRRSGGGAPAEGFVGFGDPVLQGQATARGAGRGAR